MSAKRFAIREDIGFDLVADTFNLPIVEASIALGMHPGLIATYNLSDDHNFVSSYSANCFRHPGCPIRNYEYSFLWGVLLYTRFVACI